MKKTNIIFTGILTLLMSIALYSCKKENKESLSITCDSTNVSYNSTIKPLFQNNCYSCHSNTNAASNGAGVALENYADVVNWVDTSTGSNGGTLLMDIEHKGNPMPKGRNKLPICDIAQVRNWIKEGAKNN
jgi:mono/diheme cytochrome c family protein